MRLRAFFVILASMLLAAPAAARAQRPLRTQDAEPIAAGRVRVELGLEYERDRSYPLSGLSGDLLRAPTVALAFGLGGIAEFQVGVGFNILFVDGRRPAPLADKLDFDGDMTTDIEDPFVATKIRLKHETGRRPAVALLFATRLPSAGNDSGLGNDAIDVFIELLAGKSIGETRFAGNFGLGVLSVPTQGDRQNDVVTAGLSLVRPLGERWALAAEVNGRVDVKGETPAGTEDRGQARLGASYVLKRFRLDGALLADLAQDDAELGFTAGVTYEFQGLDAEPGTQGSGQPAGSAPGRK
ncbi:MAG: hypothetical protein H0W36_00150 [Gemmatimonadetes bacterium]|nr:hypothetical protein [Gemmatimonadota bacterium]